ncbi:hypothetical protein N0V83_009946 [Neocucurbitaria cava]|uniref:Uncharacterized protein n=1 Tax=Neocucurbitaria cava TaxID=798079 RepID=A0A9W8Y0A7_9PLEO|nr:hypothetical protein N0V83_009946 [Neocucurbitaria cava]
MLIDHEAVPFINSITVTPLLPLYTVEKGIRKCQFNSNGMFQNPLSAFKTLVSFYCLHPDVPKYISDGLPAKLLQILLLTTYSGIGGYTDDYQGWVKYGMEFLRRQHFRYETLGGAYSYCEDPNDNGITTTCYLEHWLAHYYALLDETNVDRQRRVNCYDLATLGQVMLAVGLDASLDWISRSNNPFFEDGKTDPLWDPNPLWTEEHGKYRSGFRNHAFLSVTDGSAQNIEQVIDATCGPQIATLTLEEYVEAAIDHEPSKTLKFTETSGGHKAGNLISTDGDATKIKSGDGVTRISSPVDVQQYPGNKPTSGLLYAINTAASSGGKFPAGKLIGPSVHTDEMVLNINWMFTPEKDTNVPSIDMTVYSSKGNQLNLEYINRKARFDDADNDMTDIKTLYGATELSKTVVKGVVQLEPGANESFALWQQGLTGANDEALWMIAMATALA